MSFAFKFILLMENKLGIYSILLSLLSLNLYVVLINEYGKK